MSISANIRRIKVDPADDYQTLSNKVTGGVVYIPRSRDVALQFGFYEKGTFVANPSHLATITAEIRPYDDRGGTAVVVASTATIASITSGQWENDTSQHFTVTLPAAQTASLATASETPYWLVVTAITTDGKPLTLISGRCIGINDGGNYSATVPTPGDPTYVTAEQFFSAIAAISAGGGISNGYRWAVVIDPVTQEWTMNITAV